MKLIDTIPRRNRIDLITPLEKEIVGVIGSIEAAGAHPLLTEAAILMNEARNKVADWIELEETTKK